MLCVRCCYSSLGLFRLKTHPSRRTKIYISDRFISITSSSSQPAKPQSTSKWRFSHLSLSNMSWKGLLMFASSSLSELKNWIWNIMSWGNQRTKVSHRNAPQDAAVWRGVAVKNDKRKHVYKMR